MQLQVVLLLAAIGATLQHRPLVPQNYCVNNDESRCGRCLFNPTLFMNSCVACGRNGAPVAVDGVPGVFECKKLARFNTWCETPNGLEKCEMCLDGGAWDPTTETCTKFTGNPIPNCWEHTGTKCSVCKNGKEPTASTNALCDGTVVANCELVGRIADSATAVAVCYSCAAGYYKSLSTAGCVVNNSAMAGCYIGDGATCEVCDTRRGYHMPTADRMCVKSSKILSLVATLFAFFAFKL